MRSIINSTIILCLQISGLAVPILAQTSTSPSYSIESFHFESSALFKGFVRLPENYDSEKSYPLVVGLHGGGSSLDAFIEIMPEVDFIYVAPQAPYTWLIDGELGYDWALWPSGNGELSNRASNLLEDYIADLVKHLDKKYKVRDFYLMGFSQGAVYTYIAGIKNHHLLNGLIVMSGPGLLEPLISPFTGEQTDNWLKRKYIAEAKKLKIFIAHAKNDNRVKYKLAIKSRDVLKDHGYDVTFRDFEGGHNIDEDVIKSVVEWIHKK